MSALAEQAARLRFMAYCRRHACFRRAVAELGFARVFRFFQELERLGAERVQALIASGRWPE